MKKLICAVTVLAVSSAATIYMSAQRKELRLG